MRFKNVENNRLPTVNLFSFYSYATLNIVSNVFFFGCVEL